MLASMKSCALMRCPPLVSSRLAFSGFLDGTTSKIILNATSLWDFHVEVYPILFDWSFDPNRWVERVNSELCRVWSSPILLHAMMKSFKEIHEEHKKATTESCNARFRHRSRPLRCRSRTVRVAQQRVASSPWVTAITPSLVFSLC